MFSSSSKPRNRRGHLPGRLLGGSGALALAAALICAGNLAATAATTHPESVLSNGSCGGSYEIAFQANTGNLWAVGEDSRGDLGYGMMAGTSPSITCLTGGGWEIAFQANTGDLWTVGQDIKGDWGLPMMPGTSPSITSLAGGGYEVAFQGSNGDLWTAGSARVADWGVPMMAGTSPSITNLSDGSYRIAYERSDGYLAHGYDDGSTFPDSYPIEQGTSPSIAGLSDGTTVNAFEDPSNGCVTVVTDAPDCADGMGGGSSPSVISDPYWADTFVVAYQDWYTGRLDTYTVDGGVYAGYRLQMMQGTSPSITILPNAFQVAAQGSNGDLWVQTSGNPAAVDWGLGMMAGTSPSIAS